MVAPDRGGAGGDPPHDEGDRRAAHAAGFDRAARQHLALDGRRADAERQPLHQELRPCHARDGRIPRHVALAHAGDVERDADQLADARHGRLLDDPRVLHRRRDAAARRLVDRRHGRRTGRRRRARHPPVRAAGLANAIRAGRRIVLDLRPIPARKLRRPAVERLDARGLLHLGQRLPLHHLRQDGARLRPRRRGGRHLPPRRAQPQRLLPRPAPVAGTLLQSRRRHALRPFGVVPPLETRAALPLDRLPRRRDDPQRTTRTDAARRGLVGTAARAAQTGSETRLRLHRLGLRLPATQRTGSAERPDAEPQLSAYSLRTVRSRILRRPALALHGQRRATRSDGRLQRQEPLPRGRRLRPLPRGAVGAPLGQMAADRTHRAGGQPARRTLRPPCR